MVLFFNRLVIFLFESPGWAVIISQMYETGCFFKELS